MTTQPGEIAEPPKDLFLRIGQLTRLLRDSMANLGLEQAIKEVADAFPTRVTVSTTLLAKRLRPPIAR